MGPEGKRFNEVAGKDRRWKLEAQGWRRRFKEAKRGSITGEELVGYAQEVLTFGGSRFRSV